MEDWLSPTTRAGVGSGGGGAGDGGGDGGAIAAVVDQMAEQMDSLQRVLTQSDVSRALVDEKLGNLADAVDRMTTRLEAQGGGNDALMRVAEGQDRLIDVIERQGTGDGIDAESRMRLRSIDVQMLRILEEISAGRQETMAELRTDISALATALSQPRGQNRKLTQGGGGRNPQGQSAGDS